MSVIDSRPTIHRRWPRRLIGQLLLRQARIHTLPDLTIDEPCGFQSIRILERANTVDYDLSLDRAEIEARPPAPTVRMDGISFHSLGKKPSMHSRPLRRLGIAFQPRQRADAPPDLESLLPLLINPELIARSYGPLVLPHPLYAFQREGIRFLLDTTPGALLADDMGLGKTVQAIVALRMLFHRREAKRALVVAPKSVLTSWKVHFQEWAPTLEVAEAQGSPAERAHIWRDFLVGRIDACLTSYDTLRRDFSCVGKQSLNIDVLIADEVQQIKNPSAQRTRAMRRLSAKRRWGMSGTPLENSVDEFAAVLHFLDRRLPDARGAQRRRRGAAVRGADPGQHASHVRRSAERIMLRRRKQQVLDQLPALVSNAQYITLTDEQRRAYELAEHRGIDLLHGQPRNIANVLKLIHTLKRICNGVEDRSAKLEWLNEYIEIASSRGEKVLVFSQYTHSLPAAVKARFPLKYDGSLSGAQRDAVVEAFSRGAETDAMLISTRAGGLGLNLQAANHVVHFDSWWNPAVQQQATARAHRLGQTRTVIESTLISTGTIEERIQALLEQKRRLFSSVVDELSVEGVASRLTVDELYSLFEREQRRG